MNRERAETFLRLLAEAELREPPRLALPAPASPGAPLVMMSVALTRAAWALTVVGALDPETAQAILTDTDLALAARYRPEPPEAGVITGAGPGWAAGPAGQGWAAGPAGQGWAAGPAGQGRFARATLVARTGWRTPQAGSAAPAAPQDGPNRYVPIGRLVLFHDQTVSAEFGLMSYAHTASGARLITAWQARDPLSSGRRGPPPVEAFTVTDDRGNRYALVFDPKGRPEPTCDLSLRPDPPPGILWLDIAAPGEQAVRIDLNRPAGLSAPQVSDVDLGAGQHLLNRIAERLLTLASEFPAQLATMTPVPLTSLTAGLGAVIAALEAAEVLSPLSPVPGRLATLCASLGVRDHGITAAPAPDLPEPWLSLLSHYHRRKPDTAPTGDGFAAVAAALPELDGIKLVLLGLHNCDGGTWMNALALGCWADRPPVNHGPLGLEANFPLSIWVRDSAGRWHVARSTGWHREPGEATLTLRLTPPLPRSCPWIEVLATGPSAEVRAMLPLGWGYPP
jgi:hypothetical protein